MNGNSKSEKVVKILLADNTSIILEDLKKQLQIDILNGLLSSTLSATKIAREHIEKFINNEDIDSNLINRLCRYYYGAGGEHKLNNSAN